jgi:hypothetical protein
MLGVSASGRAKPRHDTRRREFVFQTFYSHKNKRPIVVPFDS